MSLQFRHMSALVLLSAACIGCGESSDAPPLGEVSGKVTKGGQPLASAEVTFSPVDGGRPSVATTDSEGYYELMYTPDLEGAVIGEHIVTVALAETEENYQSETTEDSDADDSLPRAALDGSIKKTVKAGSNDIPIDL